MNKKYLLIILNALSLTYSLPQEAWSNIDSYLPLIEHMSSVSKLHKAAAEDAVIEKISTTQLMQKEDLYEINKKSGKLIADCILKNTKVVDRKILGLESFGNVLYYRPTVTLDEFRDILEDKRHGIRYFDQLKKGIEPNDPESREWHSMLLDGLNTAFPSIFMPYAHFIEYFQGNVFPESLCTIREHLPEYTELIKILGEWNIKPDLLPNVPLIKQITVSNMQDNRQALYERLVQMYFIVNDMVIHFTKDTHEQYSVANNFINDMKLFLDKNLVTDGPFERIGAYLDSLIASFFPISISSLLPCCTR